jgi:hypothetical protein
MFLKVTEGNEFREGNIFSIIDTSQVANEITNCSTRTDSFLYQDNN